MLKIASPLRNSEVKLLGQLQICVKNRLQRTKQIIPLSVHVI